MFTYKTNQNFVLVTSLGKGSNSELLDIYNVNIKMSVMSIRRAFGKFSYGKFQTMENWRKLFDFFLKIFMKLHFKRRIHVQYAGQRLHKRKLIYFAKGSQFDMFQTRCAISDGRFLLTKSEKKMEN